MSGYIPDKLPVLSFQHRYVHSLNTLCGLVDATWCAVALAVVFALLFTWVQSKTRMASDTVIGVFSSTAVALGIFISTLDGHSFTKFNSLLIGDILSVSPAKIGILALILLLVIVFWVLRINRLTLTATYPVLAVSRGIRVNLLDALFNCAIAVVVTLSLTWVGLLVINSLLVLPGAAARNVAKNMRQYTWLALLGAVVSGIAGLMISFYVGSSTGASITLCLAVFFAVTFCFRHRK